MTLPTLYYLAYLCAFFTAGFAWFAPFYFSRKNYLHAHAEAGEMLYAIRKPLYKTVLSLTIPEILIFLFTLGVVIPYGFMVLTWPTGLFVGTSLALAPVFHYRFARTAFEIRERGLVISGLFHFPFLAWEEIDSCIWNPTQRRLMILTAQPEFTSPIIIPQAEKACSILQRFIEVRDEYGAILSARSSQPFASESDTAMQKRYANRRRYQFSILSLLMWTVVVAAACSWFAVDQKYNRLQQKALNALSNFSAQPGFSSQSKDRGVVVSLCFDGPVKFADQDMALLKPFHRLETLIFFRSALTDAAIPEFISMHSLKSIVLIRTKITPQGFERLKKEMPNTKITYD